METKKVTTNPSPEQRPDLYDEYDIRTQEQSGPNPVKTPDRIQKLIAERGQRKPAEKQ